MSFEKAAARSSAGAEKAYLAGLQALLDGDDALAERCLREAMAIDPEHADAAANLGYVLSKKTGSDDAEKFLRLAIQLDPRCAEAFLNLGGLLTTSKRYAEAEAICINAVSLRPQSPQSWSNLGVWYARQKREAEAEQCYRTAMSLDATHLASRFNLSYLLLRQGHYEEGWQCLEARRWYAAIEDRVACPRWQGESLQGKSLLITYEAGHGDMIHFIRYARVLRRQRPRSIDLVCHPALKALFAGQSDLDRVYAFNESVPQSDWDFWTPPLSIPYHCKTRLQTIPDEIPYLRASAEKLALWAPQLPAGPRRVGVVWKGSVGFENDADRSLPSLEVLVPLGEFSHIRFIGLQKGAGENIAGSSAASALRMENIGPRFEDFSDTAAVVSQLDLVISVDTGVAHLAGALGVPCWILLPDHLTDWRWLKDRRDSPWYPDVVRLFRQTRAGDWSDVVAEIKNALGEFFEKNE